MLKNIRAYRCRCGYYFIQLSDDLWYGPVTDIPVAHLMDSFEYVQQYPDCAAQPAVVVSVFLDMPSLIED